MSRISKELLILFLIIILGIFLRFYRILDFPVQLNHDEVSQLYDAISIAQTHKDIYGNFLPSIFVSVNDYKSPFYTYITSLFYFFVGGEELTIKLPAAIFGSLIVLAVYFFTLRLFENKKIGLAAAFLTATTPFEIFFSRKSFENVAGIFFMLLGFTCLLIFNSRKSTKALFSGVILLSLALYTYFSHAIIIPILLTSYILIFKKHLLRDFKQSLLSLLLLLILFSPLIIIIITNPNTSYRSQTVFVTQDVNLGKNIEFAESTNQLITFLGRSKAILDFSFNRYLEQFNPIFIFGNGLDLTNQGPLGVGPLLFIQLPFLILGIIYLIKLKDFKREKLFILAWIILGMLPSGLTFEPHSPHRSIMVFTMLNIISAVGLFYLWNLLNKLQKDYAIFKASIIIVISLSFVINYIYFLYMYFVNFPFEKSQELHYPFKQVAQFAWQNHDNFDQIIFDPLFGETAPVIGTAAHYYLAYYGNFPPVKFQQEYRKGNKVREVLFDKFSIRKIDWRTDQNLKNVLVIGSSWSLPLDTIDKGKIIKTFYFYNRHPAFYAVKL